ncbi:hypothetical protein KZJ38_17050 [Paraburkholderia edwinii]|jgi:hypothetical protein|uniref:Uncharacterized protein n=1 Tax=Paraburkholderia edwinii TaxID=2861782 RepID=A0ABX8UI16_9BURK|nr:hypothetical protein [Paraburkholderia edwinii]QYD67987.1 hypothetical protein KZJ38_17050 [Paraburkholderia edwinii]
MTYTVFVFIRRAWMEHRGIFIEMKMPKSTWYRMPMIGRSLDDRKCGVQMRNDESGVLARFIPDGERPIQLEGSFADESAAYGAVIAEVGRYFNGDYPRMESRLTPA